jgi:tripartite-type tricarboxylate transporter receptor subunit TctC
MTKPFSRLVAASLALGTLSFATLSFGTHAVNAQSDAYPNKPVRVIVPSPPGGNTDVSARFIAEALTRKWGQQVLVENRPGAGSNIGLKAAAASAPDGYTLFATTNSQMTIDPVVDPPLAEQNKAFIPIVQVAQYPIVIVASTSFPGNTFADLVAAAKANPGKLGYATAGIASVPHLAAEWIASAAGIKLRHIPFKGGGASAAAVASGELPLASIAASAAVPFVKSGRIKPLVVTLKDRVPASGDWPVASEVGLPNISISVWTGLFVVKGTRPDIIAKIEKDVKEILADKDFAERLRSVGGEVGGVSGPAFAKLIADETEIVRKIVTEADIKIQ